MPREGITAYDLLISCPEDVSDYLVVIKKSVENFNRTFGVINNIHVVTKHWSTDSYPQSGNKPQKLLNNQFVRECDAAIAIFWTRFGTPTDKFNSGTEEEIEEMLSAGKQVFMYFLDTPIDPSKICPEQHRKVLDFKEKYKNKGVYDDVKDKHDLERKFSNHLALYFLSLITGEKVEANIKLKPILLVKDISLSDQNDCFLYKHNLCDSRLMSSKREQILTKIDVLINTCLPVQREFEVEPEDMFEEQPSYLKKFDLPAIKVNLNKFSPAEDVSIDEHCITIVNEFARENKKKFNDGFWDLGGLKKNTFNVTYPFGTSISLEGTEEEKERYKLLQELCLDVKSYNEYNNYFHYLEGISMAKLVISNVGNSFDEDIDVKLLIQKGKILRHSNLPYPGINIIEKLTKMEFADYMFSIQESESVDKYGYYPVQLLPPLKNIRLDPLYQQSASDKYKDFKKEYRQKLESLFLYRVFEKENYDILTFHVEYLKHNTSMAFPSVLMFKDTPKYIEYEVSSKHIPDVFKGILNLQLRL